MAALSLAPEVIEIAIADISNRFDVRRSLDEDRIIMLAELYQGGADIPPITVIEIAQNGKYAFIDGRHRAAARSMLDLPTIQATVTKNDLEPFQLYANALQANWGGAKPPTREDVVHTIINMMELGAKERDVNANLKFLPASALRLYVKNAKGVIHSRLIRKALDLVANGASVQQAAAKTGLDAEQVKDAVTGKKRSFSTGGRESPLADLKRYISLNLRRANSGIGQKIETMIRQLEDGEVDSATVIKAIDAWETHLKGTLHRVKDWRERAAQTKA